MLNHLPVHDKATLCPDSFLYQTASRNFFTKLCLLLLFLLLTPLHSHSNPSATTLSITSLEETSISSRKPFDSASTNISSNKSQSTSGLSSKSPPLSDPPLILLSTSPIQSNPMSLNYFSASCTTRSTASTTCLWDSGLTSRCMPASCNSLRCTP